MPEIKETAGSDEKKEVTLDSQIIYAAWSDAAAYGGQKARFEVATAFVGNGAKIEATGKSENGKKLGKVKGKILANKFLGEFDIPEDIEPKDKVYFEVSLPGNSLDAESNRIPAFPPIRVSQMKWSADEVKRGDVVTLSAKVTGMKDDSDVLITVYEFDNEGLNDKVAKLDTKVKDKKVELEWEFDYYGKIEDIPVQQELEPYKKSYQQPQFYFTVTAGNDEFGKKQESGLIKFIDWFEIECEDPYGEPAADYEYILTLPDGTEKKGKLDKDGKAKIEGVPPGAYDLEIIPKDDDNDNA
ncbi:MAG: hypothetical protein R3F48_10995 [Candidatus Zixiibacteriota bacterium]